MTKVTFPKNLIGPIANALRGEEQKLKDRRKKIDKEDPFKDTNRITDNAAIDTDASEQFGHVNVEGLRKEIDKTLIQIRKALTRIKIGKYGTCEICGEMIDTDRLVIFPAATKCVSCEKKTKKTKK